jgi:hypothetical protein
MSGRLFRRAPTRLREWRAMRVAARDEDIFGIEFSRSRKPLPQLGDVWRHQCHQIETDDRDPVSPIIDEKDPTPQRPLHSITTR